MMDDPFEGKGIAKRYVSEPMVSDMTLRDHFAWQALPVIVSAVGSGSLISRGTGAETVAYECYQIADAMMEARKK